MLIILVTVIFSLSAFAVMLLIPKILLISTRKRLLDIPNKRKVHTAISSRLGGAAFYPGIILPLFLSIGIYSLIDSQIWNITITPWLLLTIAATQVMYIVGIIDDIIHLRYGTKFICQLFAAMIVLISGSWVNDLYGFLGIHTLPVYIGMMLTLFLTIFIINSINLIDGIDGLASGLSVIALLCFAIIFYIDGQVSPLLLSIATLGTLLAFFRYNVWGLPNKSTKIFMGDSGSLIIGIIISSLAFKLCFKDNSVVIKNAPYNLFIAYSVLIIPCFDVVQVVFHRLKNKQRLFHPDKNHFHHKLLTLGLSPHQALIAILGCSIGFILLNMLLEPFISMEVIMALDVTLWILIHIKISHLIRNKVYPAKKNINQKHNL